MAALPDVRADRRPVIVVCAIAATYLAMRLALLWRFPWFLDETIFASYAKQVHADIGQFFVAENDQKGLLPSWLGAGLIGSGFAPVTAVRLLSAAGAAVAAACGGLVVRRLYGAREGLVTAALIALGPYFLVTASLGIYDASVTGLVTAAVLISIRLAQRPRLLTAIVLGGVLGAGGLTKPTAWAAAAVLPFTLLLFDYRSPGIPRRLLRFAGVATLALALGYAIACIARLTPLYSEPSPPLCAPGVHAGNLCPASQQSLGRLFSEPAAVRANVVWLVKELFGYLTPPGVTLAVVGAVAAWRRRRAAAAFLAVWAMAVLASVAVLSIIANPRYFAVAIVPLSAFIAIGAVAVWQAVVRCLAQRPRVARPVAAVLALLALAPAASFEARVVANPARASYPGLDNRQYVTARAALRPLRAVAAEIEARGGPYPVRVDAGPYPDHVYTDIGPWGIDLLLNGSTVGRARRYVVIYRATPGQKADARYLLSDGERTDAPPRRGYRLILRLERPEHGSVMRLYERAAGPAGRHSGRGASGL